MIGWRLTQVKIVNNAAREYPPRVRCYELGVTRVGREPRNLRPFDSDCGLAAKRGSRTNLTEAT